MTAEVPAPAAPSTVAPAAPATPAARHAIYFAPPCDSPWWALGARWLGRDERSDVALPTLACDDMAPVRQRALTEAPRRYGFHATLKAPFRLRAGVGPAQLSGRTAALAARHAPLPLGPLTLQHLDGAGAGFVALVPEAPPAGLAALEADCVTGLDDLRAPPDAADPTAPARRTNALDAHAKALLARWGYPHVLDRFRLHFTLTGPIDVHEAHRVLALLRPTVAALNAASPLVLDRLCLFVEPAPPCNFLRVADLPLGVPAR